MGFLDRFKRPSSKVVIKSEATGVVKRVRRWPHRSPTELIEQNPDLIVPKDPDLGFLYHSFKDFEPLDSEIDEISSDPIIDPVTKVNAIMDKTKYRDKVRRAKIRLRKIQP